MKKVLAMAGVAIALVLGSGAGEPAVARTASVCQFYKGDPVCKTVEESYCVAGSVGIEGKVCRTTIEYWYWS